MWPPNLPWKVRLFVTAFGFLTDASFRRNGSVNRRFINLIDFKISPSDKPVNGVTTSDNTVDPSRNLWFRYFLPSAAEAGEKLPVIVYFHGGGFVMLSPSSQLFDDLCRRLAKELPAVIVSVNYRLAPEHRCPASAGGNIAHHVTARAGEHNFTNLNIAGVIPIQPYFGGEERTESEIQLAGAPLVSVERTDWCWKAFLPEGSDRDHPAANVFGPKSSDVSGLKFPKSLVFMGGFDPLRDWQESYCEGLKGNGKEVKVVDYPNAMHSFYAFPDLPESTLFMRSFKISFILNNFSFDFASWMSLSLGSFLPVQYFFWVCFLDQLHYCALFNKLSE
ncbi:putative carboxylesterase 18 [Vitis vinifera]|uniref:Putative carboxylesterase 18 n=1 Tax=Vitis vinifera TaxID=29760 RepID=A0A438FJC8_VITVI|nr:putative carboxylesterase 18 [Vitis vinifera]